MAFQAFRTGQAYAGRVKWCSPARAPYERRIEMAQRYQNGHLRLAKRKSGPDVWEFLWRERGPDGRQRQRTLTVGNLQKLPTHREAMNWFAFSSFYFLRYLLRGFRFSFRRSFRRRVLGQRLRSGIWRENSVLVALCKGRPKERRNER